MITPKRPLAGNRVAAANLVKSRAIAAAAKISPARSAAKARSGTPFKMTKGHWIAFGVVMLLLGGGVAWAVIHFSKDTRFDDLVALREKMLDPSLTPEERRDLQEEIQRRRESLMPEVQKKAADSSAIFMQMMTNHMKQVLALPDDQRLAAVDRDIDNMEAMRKMFGGRGGRPAGQGEARNGDQSTTSRNDSNQKSRNDSNQNRDDSRGRGGPGGRPPGFGGGPMGTDAQRAAFHNQLLSSIPADTRASFHTYVQLFQARAFQRGVNLPQGGPR